MRLFKTKYIEAIDPPTPRHEAKTPPRKSYNSVLELKTVEARNRVCIYGVLPVVAMGLRKHEGRER